MSFWSVAQTETHREGTAVYFLEQAGFEVYLPKIKIKQRVVPLFPSYVFVRILDRWYPIATTIGVVQLLLAGDHPARLKDEIISNIKNKERGGLVRLPEPKGLKRGDRIRIKQGSFGGHLAIFEGMSGRNRTRALLDLLGRKVVVELSAEDFQPLNLA
jgi:transcriptional antiterminator RfaH